MLLSRFSLSWPIVVSIVLLNGFSSSRCKGQLGREFGPTFQQATENPYLSEQEKEKKAENLLQVNKVENIYTSANYTTQIKFDTKKEVQRITKGSEIIQISYDKTSNTIDIFPTVQEGQTNMNVTIDGVTYVFVVHIVNDDRLMYRKTYSFPLSQEEQSASPRISGPPLPPQDIDVVFYIQAIERSRQDPAYFKAMQQTMQAVPLDKVYVWNGCPIYLVEAVQFPKDNLVVLKVQWQNLTDNALYLAAEQYKVFVANTPVPVTASSQLSATLFPGQMDTVYLFIQGYDLNANNAFELQLPPEAESIRRLLESNTR